MRRLHLINLISALLLAALAAACQSIGQSPSPTPVSTGEVFTVTETPLPFQFTDKGITFTELGKGFVAINVCTKNRDVGTTLKVEINTDPNGTDKGRWEVIKELGVPCFNTDNRPVWDTNSFKPGTYLVKAWAKESNDPNWLHPISITRTYEVKSGVNGHQ